VRTEGIAAASASTPVVPMTCQLVGVDQGSSECDGSAV
jgi:hypothetical protein